MDKTLNLSLIYGVIGLLLGIILTIIVVNGQMYGTMRMMGMGGAANSMMQIRDSNNRMGMDMSMNDMSNRLQGKTGDDFDKTFIAGMIIHHEGAINMANEAKVDAKHQEIKNLAEVIITAQAREISDMKGWYKAWYGVDVPSYYGTMMGR